MEQLKVCEQQIILFPSCRVKDIYFSGRNTLVLYYDMKDKALRIWNVEKGEYVLTLEEQCGYVCSACFSPNGKQALSAIGGTVKLWNVETGDCIRVLLKHDFFSYTVCFSLNGKYALIKGQKTVRILNIETGKFIYRYVDKWADIVSAFFSSDGNDVHISTHEQRTHMFEPDINKTWLKNIIYRKDGNRPAFYSVCFSPDGNLAFSGKALYDVATGECIRTLDKDNGCTLFKKKCFSPDGKLVLSERYNRTVKLWDVATGKCLHTFSIPNTILEKICFSPDGREIAFVFITEIHFFALDFELQTCFYHFG